MGKVNHPPYAIIKKNGIGIPHNPTAKAKLYIEKSRFLRKYLFPDSEVSEGEIIEPGNWMFVQQYKRKDMEWRDASVDTDPDEYNPGEPSEQTRFIYRLRK